MRSATATLFVACLSASLLAAPVAAWDPHVAIQANPADTTPSSQHADRTSPDGAADASLARSLADAEAHLRAQAERFGIATSGPSTPEFMMGLTEAFRFIQQAQNQSQAQQNSTQFAGNVNGTQTHHHGNIGEQGLNPVWATTFHGIPLHLVTIDITGDQVLDVIVGSDIAVSAYNGATMELLWARHLGSTVSSLFITDANNDGKSDVGYATYGGGLSPRVGMLRAESGAILWEYVGENSFMGAAPLAAAASSDILAVDVAGHHLRLSAGTGDVLFDATPSLLDDVGAIVASHFTAGHSLAAFGDLNGDGVGDLVSVAVTYDYAILLAFTVHSIVYATNGATGELLWAHDLAPDPAYVHYNFATGLALADVMGDGSADVAVSYYDYRMEYVPFVTPTSVTAYDMGIRVLDGSSVALGRVLGQHSIPTPELALEYYHTVKAWDTNGDGAQEIATLRTSTVEGLVGPASRILERYAFGKSATGNPTMAALSDIKVPAEGTATILRVPTANAVPDMALTTYDGTKGILVRVAPDGTVATPLETKGDIVTAAVDTSQGLLTGSALGITLRTAEPRFAPMRGTPFETQSGDYDGDGHQDFWVRASDGRIHIVDAVTGAILADNQYGPSFEAVSFRLRDLTSDGIVEVIQVRQNDDGQGIMQAWPAQGGDALYTTSVPNDYLWRSLWLDANGDGAPDFATMDPRDGIAVVSGSDGRVLWNKMPNLPDDRSYLYVGSSIAASLGGGAEDLVLYDSSSEAIIAVDGDNGNTLFTADLPGDYFGWVVCMGAADTDGDGAETAFVVYNYYDDTFDYVSATLTFDATGGKGSLDLFNNDDGVAGCAIGAYTPTGATASDLIVAGSSSGDGAQGGVGRFDARNNAWTWKRFAPTSDVEQGAYRFLGDDPSALGGGRMYVSYQDHVYGLFADNGTTFGEFTPNGPCIRNGIASDLDLSSPKELVVSSSDGILWALTDRQLQVASALAAAAQENGKEIPGSFAPSLAEEDKAQLAAQIEDGGTTDAGKKTPALPMTLAALALVGLALLARRK